MIRFILAICLIGLYLVGTLPILFLLWLIGLKKPLVRDAVAQAMIRGVFRFLLMICGTQITVLGKERIPKDQPVLYVGNHRSLTDILLVYTSVPGSAGFVAKIELQKFPIFNVWMKYIHCLFLDRSDPKQGLRTILSGVEKLKNGICICIFPEGTRNKTDSDLSLLPFHNGSFKMATKADCPIVPIAMLNTVKIFEAQFPKVRKTHVVLEFGEPILPSELSREDKKNIGVLVQTRILEMLEKNQKLL